jgi:hypothetical protein
LEPLQNAFLEAHRHPSTRTLMQELLLQRFEAPIASAYDVLRQEFGRARRFWRERPLAAVIHPAFSG